MLLELFFLLLLHLSACHHSKHINNETNHNTTLQNKYAPQQSNVNIHINVFVLTALLEDNLQVVQHCAPEDRLAQSYNDEVEDYCISHWPSASKLLMETGKAPADANDDDSRTTSYAKDLAARFFKFFNRSVANMPVHHCQRLVKPYCCKSDEESQQKAADVGNEFLNSRVPSTPATNKWTKTDPSVDFAVMGHLVFGYIAPVFSKAYKDLKFESPDTPSTEPGGDPVSFSAMSGKRMRDALCCLQDPLTTFRMKVYAISVETTRYLTQFFFKCCKARLFTATPPLLDILLPQQSPLTAVHQYTSSLLLDDDAAGRLLLIWKQECSTWQEWVSRHLVDGRLRDLRRSLLLADCWIYRRHDCRLLKLPWLLCALCDDRASDEFKHYVCSIYDSKRVCCLSGGLAWQLKKRGIGSHDLRTLPRHLCCMKLYAFRLYVLFVSDGCE